MGMISIYVVLACCAAAPAADVQVKLLRGSDVKGKLVAVSAEKLTLSSVTGERAIPANELRSVEFPQARNEIEKPRVWLELLDFSLIAATNVSLVTGKAIV